MPTLTIKLTNDLQQFVDEQVAAGDHVNAEAFIASVLEAERKRRVEASLVKLVEEAEASGPATPLTKADVGRLKRRVWERALKRKNLTKAERRRAEAKLLALVEEAEASGPARFMTDEDWQRLEQELVDREASRTKRSRTADPSIIVPARPPSSP